MQARPRCRGRPAASQRLTAAVHRPACWRAGKKLGGVEDHQHATVQAVHGRGPRMRRSPARAWPRLQSAPSARRQAGGTRACRAGRGCRRGMRSNPNSGCALDRVRPSASALVRRERRRLHENHRQRRQADVGHRVAPVAAVARIRRTREARPQPVETAPEVLHGVSSATMVAASTARRSAGGIAA